MMPSTLYLQIISLVLSSRPAFAVITEQLIARYRSEMARRISPASSSTRIMFVRSPLQSSRQTMTPPLFSTTAPTFWITPPVGQPVSRIRLADAGTGRVPAA